MAVHDKIFLFFKIILIMIKPYDILIKYEKKSILNIIVKKLFTLQNIIYILQFLTVHTAYNIIIHII